MAKKVKATKKTEAAALGIGVGLTAAAVAAAGAYFLYGSEKAGENRKKVKSWALMAKGEVLEALEQAEHITAEDFKALVESVSGAYASVEGATKGDIKDFKREMLEHWQKLENSGVAKKVITTAKKATKKVTKKVTKKATKKKVAKKAPKKTAKKTTTAKK